MYGTRAGTIRKPHMFMKEKEREEFQLTDGQVIARTLKYVRVYADSHEDEAFNVNDCVDFTVHSVKDVWREARGIYRYYALSWDDMNEIARITLRVEDELRKKATAKATDILKEIRIRKINMTAAKTLLTSELRSRGLQYFFEWQKRRVKVCVKLQGGNALSFYVKYSDINKGKLPSLMEDLSSLIEKYDSLGGTLRIWGLTGRWKQFSGWND